MDRIFEEPIERPHPIHVGAVCFSPPGAGIVGLAIGAKRLPGINLLASAFSVNGFQIYTTSGIPSLTAKSYSLNVGGLVDSRRPTSWPICLPCPARASSRIITA